MSKVHLVKQVAEFVDQLEKSGGQPLYELTPKQARKVLREVQKDVSGWPAADVEELSVPGRPLRLQIIRPSGEKRKLPVVFYIHGGGWVMGDEITHGRLVRHLAADVPAAVVFPIYTPSPEAGYPQTTDDLFAALRYITEHGASYNLDVENLAVAGDSVGGNMALAMALMAKQNNFFPKIKFLLLLYPVAVAAFETESYSDYADGPWLTKKAMQWFWDAYSTDGTDRNSIYASPLKASVAELAKLPPALVITDENDVLRDEGEMLARKLDEAGVETACVRFNGTIHDFLMLNALADSAPSKTALLLATARLREVFNQN